MAKQPPQSANDSPVPRPPQLPRTIADAVPSRSRQTLQAWGHDEPSFTNPDASRTARRLWAEFIGAAFRLSDRLGWLEEQLVGGTTDTTEEWSRTGWIAFWKCRISMWLDSNPEPTVDAWQQFQPSDNEDRALAEVGRWSESSYNTVWVQLKDCRAAFSEFCEAWGQLKGHCSGSSDESPSGERTEQPKNSAAEIGADVAEKDETPPKGKIKRTIRFEDLKTPVPERFKLLGKPCGPFVGNLTQISLAVGRGKPGRAEVLKERCDDKNPVIWITESGERETKLRAYFIPDTFKAIARQYPERFSDEVKKNHPDIFRPSAY